MRADVWPLLIIAVVAIPLGLAIFKRGERYVKKHRKAGSDRLNPAASGHNPVGYRGTEGNDGRKADCVLLVDDEPMFLEAVRALLALDDRIDVVGASDNGKAALELADERRPDVALVDLAMPGMSGYEVTKQLLKSSPAMRVLAVSSLSSQRDEELAREAGATAFLLKGGLHDEVAEAIVAAVRS